MNKFEPPLGGKSADPEDGVHRGYEQAQAGQRAPASFSGGEPAPPKPNYGTFFTVYPSDRRQSEAWAGAFIGILVGVFRLFAFWGVGVMFEASRGSWTVSWNDDRTQELASGASITKTRT